MEATNISIYSAMQPQLIWTVLTEVTKYTRLTEKTRDIKMKYSKSPARPLSDKKDIPGNIK
jgi:hypothetical protein